MQDPIVIVAAKRTAVGAFQGSLKNFTSPQLASHVIADIAKVYSEVDDVFMGCVLPAGVGQAPARQAAILGKLDKGVRTTTVNKVCGSGMQSIILGANTLLLNQSSCVIAGGMESMTNAPYLLPKARAGLRMGHASVVDHMFFDGLEDAYQKGCLMGHFAENTAEKYGFSRQDQDDFAINSVKKALSALDSGAFKNEIVALSEKDQVIDTDEPPLKAKIDKVPSLKPAFRDNGTVTAANSSSIADGAAAMMMMRQSHAQAKGLPILAKIVGYQAFAHEPEWFTTAPVGAMTNLLKEIGWSVADVDLFEINEAFAVVTMAAIHDLKLDPQKVNIFGGACALGHPIGASGSRIVVTLIHALKTKGLKRGIASLCIGGGEATALALEVV